MISYFILNKSGNIIYQTVPTDKLESSEQNGIKYLPLLVIKDLIKNNIHTHIKHITTGDKVFAFWERHSLLYIACTKHERIPVSVLHKHLIVMDNFLRFNFGPQWQIGLEGYIYPRSRKHTLQPPLTIKKLTSCLEQLPYVTSYCSLRSPKCLCLIEQVDLQEDLSIRLIDILQLCCNNVFIPSSSSNKSSIKISTLFSQPRKPTDKPIFYPHFHRKPQQHHHHQQQPLIQKEADRPFGAWEHAFLFAREKIVVHACNKNNNNKEQSSLNNSITTELLYFLKIMVADFIYEYCDTIEQESNLIHHDASVPQEIISKNTNPNETECETSPSTSSQTLCTSFSTTGSPSQKSTNFPFIYDSNSTLPFKISSKSSVTQLSSTATAVPQVSWSSPASSLIHSHLVTRLSKLERGTTNDQQQDKNDTMDESLLNEMMPAMKVHSLTSPLEHYQHYQHQHQQDDDLTDTSDNTTPSAKLATTGLPPNAKIHYHHHHHPLSASASPDLENSTLHHHAIDYDHPIYLSCSVPNDDGMMMDSGKFFSKDDIMEHRGASTNSSPFMRSRRESMIADYSTTNSHQQVKEDSDEGSQENHQRQKYHRQHHPSYNNKNNTNNNNNNPTAKVVQRWVKHGNKVSLSRICILKINESGLVAVILLSDDTLQLPLLFSSSTNNNNKEVVLHQHNQQMIKQISSSLKAALKDFSSFLLTKEVVHFTILSFAFSYPGLVHFVHIKDGILVSPQIVDLNELDKHHEILNNVFETYNIKPTNTMGAIIGKWRWPSVLRLKKLCDKMLNKGLSCQSSTPCIRSIQETSKKKQGFKLLYLKGEQEDEELLAIYFNFVPEDRIWFMHRKLLLDLGQRHFQK